MKFLTMERKGLPMNLQFFAEGGDDNGGDDAGEGDDPDDESDEGGDDEDDKKYTEKDMEEAIKKRLARERRKWKRQSSASDKPDSGDKAGKENADSDEKVKEHKAREEAEKKVEELENKWLCLEHDVKKDSVDDVLALAKVYMSKDDLDLEDAIDEVLKKYPQFSSAKKEDGEEEQKEKGSWGQRQKGNMKKSTGVEAAFYARNPGLKN